MDEVTLMLARKAAARGREEGLTADDDDDEEAPAPPSEGDDEVTDSTFAMTAAAAAAVAVSIPSFDPAYEWRRLVGRFLGEDDAAVGVGVAGGIGDIDNDDRCWSCCCCSRWRC